MAFTKSTADLANISKLDDEPNDVGGLSAAELKAEFDAAAETLQSFVNTHVTELESSTAAGNIGTIGLDGTTATNVQAVIVAIKALIDACETQASATASFALKEDKTVTAQHYKAVTFDTNTGIFTFTRENGSTTSIDTALEKVATNWVYDAATQSLVLTLADGSTQSISLSAFITESEYLDSDTLDFSVSDHKITATVKDGSITDTKLSSALKTTLQNYVTQAVTSATNAAASEANALTYKNTAQSAQIAAVNAQTAAETAQEDAEVSAANAATSEANAGTSATNADGSAKDSEAYAIGKRGGVDVASGDPAYQNNSKYYKEQAAAIVGGDYATKTEAQGYVDTHNAAGAAHSNLFANKANKKVPSAANNVALLDSSGNLADSGKALTPAEIGAAASSHNHSASNITSGTLSIAIGGTGAASAAAARTALGAQATLTAGTNITISGSTISATGGILPRIIATAPTGSTVTCAKGSTTLTATEASGTWTFDVPDYGTWTVTATLSGKTATKSVAVDQVKQYAASLVYLSDTFSANTWEAIVGACQSGSVPAAWVVGNQKTMTINGASYTVTIIGKNHDTYTAGGTAPLTFQLQDCYGTKYQMNSSDTNSGGWTSCAMRSTHLPAILALMPTEVKAAIQEVNKLSSAGSQSATINTTADKLFLLSEIEIFGSVSSSKSGEGSQYAYYSAGNSKVKNFGGSAGGWWERSPFGNSSVAFCTVGSDGGAYTEGASISRGVAFGFCF